jgi:hypothetical protein
MLVINDDGYGIWLGMLGMMCRRRRRRHGEILTITIIIFYCDKPMGASPRSAFSKRDIVNPACGQFLLNIVGSGSHVTWLFSICDPSQA